MSEVRLITFVDHPVGLSVPGRGGTHPDPGHVRISGAGPSQQFLHTVRGIGYKLTSPLE